MFRNESFDLAYDDLSVAQRRSARVALKDGWKKVYWMRFNYVNVYYKINHTPSSRGRMIDFLGTIGRLGNN